LTLLTQIPIKDLVQLRAVVKTQHMKHYPREQCTDREADKIIETINPETREKLIKLAVDYGITKL
jgi:hypothetical protein